MIMINEKNNKHRGAIWNCKINRNNEKSEETLPLSSYSKEMIFLDTNIFLMPG